MEKSNEKIDWWKFSKSYFNIAQLGCQELLKPKHYKYNKDDVKLKYSRDDIFVAINYNIKHGIECFLKTIRFIYNNELEKHRSHNISELFEFVRKDLKKGLKKITKVITEESEKTESLDVLLSKDEINNFEHTLSEIERVIKKFYHCDVLKNKIENDFIIEDMSNTVFRFPDNDLKIKLDYTKILRKIKKEDINEIINDLAILIKGFSSVTYMLAVYKRSETN